ncbi:hypothetical protein TNCV_4408691 [Trichonephila clavipes]|nr:hypothetical protein TNCV_4408691 [Trichonephila clavipes]
MSAKSIEEETSSGFPSHNFSTNHDGGQTCTGNEANNGKSSQAMRHRQGYLKAWPTGLGTVVKLLGGEGFISFSTLPCKGLLNEEEVSEGKKSLQISAEVKWVVRQFFRCRAHSLPELPMKLIVGYDKCLNVGEDCLKNRKRYIMS